MSDSRITMTTIVSAEAMETNFIGRIKRPDLVARIHDDMQSAASTLAAASKRQVVIGSQQVIELKTEGVITLGGEDIDLAARKLAALTLSFDTIPRTFIA